MTRRFMLLLTALATILISGCATDQLQKEIVDLRQMTLQVKSSAENANSAATAAMNKASDAMNRAEEVEATAKQAEATAQQAQSTAQQAADAANAASAKADNITVIAQDAQRCCDDNKVRTDRMYRKLMRK